MKEYLDSQLVQVEQQQEPLAAHERHYAQKLERDRSISAKREIHHSGCVSTSGKIANKATKQSNNRHLASTKELVTHALRRQQQSEKQVLEKGTTSKRSYLDSYHTNATSSTATIQKSIFKKLYGPRSKKVSRDLSVTNTVEMPEGKAVNDRQFQTARPIE